MKHLLLLSILVFAVAAFGQEAPAEEAAEPAMEAAVADTAMAADTTATEDAMDMLMEDGAVVEEAAEEDAGDALEAMLAEEGTEMVQATGSELIGYTVGLDAGYPIYLHGGLGASYDTPGPAIGLTVNTPFGAAIGPFEIGFGAQVGMYSFNDDASGNEISGLYVLGTANTSILETAQGTVSTQVGAGYFGASIGITAGAAFDYVVPNVPIVVRPYLRVNGTLDSGGNTSADENAAYSWLNVGAMVSFDISTLF